MVVVIVTYNSADVVGTLLDSVPPALDGLPAHVVVVDNGSSDESVAVVTGRVDQVVRQQNLGFAAGINAGVHASPSHGHVVVLNPDTVLTPGSLRVLVAALDAPGVGVSAPLVREQDGSTHHSLRREPTLLRALGLGRTGRPSLSEYVLEPEAYRSSHVVDWALGAVLAVARECHEDVGGWDDSFFLYSEETDFCLRARDRGWSTQFVPGSVVTHIGGGSGRSDRTHVMQIVNRVRLYARRHGRAGGLAYLVLSVLSEISWLVRGHPQSRAAVLALLLPGRRPAELGCSDSLVPR